VKHEDNDLESLVLVHVGGWKEDASREEKRTDAEN